MRAWSMVMFGLAACGGGSWFGSGGDTGPGLTSIDEEEEEGQVGVDDTGEDAVVGSDVVADEVVGRAWQIDLGAVSWQQPAGLASLALDEVDHDLLLGIRSLDVPSGTIGIRSGGADDAGRQDFCVPSSEHTGTVAGRTLTVTSEKTLHVAPETVPLAPTSWTLTGTISEAGVDFIQGELQGQHDLRASSGWWAPLIDSSDPDDMCATVVGMGVSCEACPDGAELCVPVVGTGVQGALVALEVESTDGC